MRFELDKVDTVNCSKGEKMGLFDTCEQRAFDFNSTVSTLGFNFALLGTFAFVWVEKVGSVNHRS
jgi:hypothetical protein